MKLMSNYLGKAVDVKNEAYQNVSGGLLGRPSNDTYEAWDPFSGEFARFRKADVVEIIDECPGAVIIVVKNVKLFPGQRSDGVEKKTFEQGTIAQCNRCSTKFPLPKVCEGVRENEKCFRLQTMCTSPVCGHMDAHWVMDADQKRED